MKRQQHPFADGTHDALASMQVYAVVGAVCTGVGLYLPLMLVGTFLCLGACGYLAYGTAKGWGERE